MTIKEEINGCKGYSIKLFMSHEELSCIRESVSICFKNNIENLSIFHQHRSISFDMEYYHLMEFPFEHGDFWSKERRILPTCSVDRIRSMGFFKRLEEEFGPIRISNEEELLPEEITWRLVRPGRAEDVGPVHADSWFWALGHGRMPAGYRRFKIWIPLYTEPGCNGILCAPGTHRLPHPPYRAERRGKIMKPALDVDPQTLGLCLLPLEPGTVFAFHDDLLHGGAVNIGTTCRVSIEFTCLYEDGCEPADGAGRY